MNNEKITIRCSVCHQPRKVSIKSLMKRKIENNRCRSCAAEAKSNRLAPIRIGNCVLHSKSNSRCEEGYRCEHYTTCMTATSKRNWAGWSAEPITEEEKEEPKE